MSFLHNAEFHRRVYAKTEGESLTEQSHLERTEVHNIMRQYEKTGIIEHRKMYDGKYMDMANPLDFKQVMDMVSNANQMFETIPSKIRRKFDNDPAQFIAFMQNPENYDAINEMGLDNSHLPKPAEKPIEPSPEPSPTPEA